MTLMAMVLAVQKKEKKNTIPAPSPEQRKMDQVIKRNYTTSKPAKPQFPRFGFNQRVHFQSIGKNIEIVLCLSLRNDA